MSSSRPSPSPRTARARVRTLLLRVLVVGSGAVLVISAACGGSTEEPGLLGLGSGQDASIDATPSATSTSTAPVKDSSTADTGPACATVESLLGTYGIDPACGPCIDLLCSSTIATCNGNCSCPSAAVGYVECIGLGAEMNTCATVASMATDPSIIIGVLMCASKCEEECKRVDGGLGDDGGSEPGDASDAASAADGASEAGG